MLNSFENHIKTKTPFLKNAKLLVAISGGLDSVVLTHLCKTMNLNFALAHCNFKLRGEESDADEAFVLELAEHLGLELFVEYFDTENYAQEHTISIQMAARDLRYRWFNALADHLRFDYILTAHHADDNLETFLINLSRGSGLDGLTGIPATNEKLCRPLLSYSRSELEDYATSNNLQWREDSSNSSSKYLRNKLRHEIIPKLKETHPHFLDNFKSAIAHLNEARGIIADRIDTISDEIVEIHEDCIILNINNLKALDHSRAYLYQLLKEYGFTQWDDVVDLLDAQSGKQLFSKDWRLLKDREFLKLSANTETEAQPIQIDNFQNEVLTPSGTLLFEESERMSDSRKNVIYVDLDLLKWPLIIKKWEAGDSFYPFGMKGKKKLSKYFKDEKMSLIDKERSWLLCSDSKIVWVIGHRADDRFKVSDKTRRIMKIELI